MDQFQRIKDLVVSTQTDFDKFYKDGNKAAGRRIRKAMQELKNIATEIRKEVQERVNESKKDSKKEAKDGSDAKKS
ncbi:MAG: histone H1 [Bacteroidia bacterium]|nr:histone H1 [Bacteroidia bacterium]